MAVVVYICSEIRGCYRGLMIGCGLEDEVQVSVICHLACGKRELNPAKLIR